ncbi:MAG: SMR family transporter [Methylococcaceae bacterium]
MALLNKADGLTHLNYLLTGLLLLNLGMLTFSLSLKSLDMTIANTTWAGLSILVVAVIGYFHFDEKYTLVQYLFISWVLFGLIGLNLTGINK